MSKVVGRRERSSSVTPTSTAVFLTPTLGLRLTLDTTFPTCNLKGILHRMKSAARLSSFLCLSSLVIATWENSRYFSMNFELDFLGEMLRSLDGLIALVQVLCILRFYSAQLAFKRAYQKNSHSGSIWKEAESRRYLLLEIAVALINIPPQSEQMYEITALGKTSTISLDDILYPFHLLRLYHIPRLLLVESNMFTSSGIYHLNMLRREPEVIVYLKVLVACNTYLVSTVVIILIGVVSGLLLYIYERTVPDSQMTSIYNTVYSAGVTMATIGYGDIIPQTHVGRGILLIAAILGNYAQAILTLGVDFSGRLKGKELSFARKIHRDQYCKTTLRIAAAQFLQMWWKLRLMRVHRKGDRLKMLLKTNYYKLAFKKKSAIVEATSTPSLRQEIRTDELAFGQAFSALKSHISIKKCVFELSADLVTAHFSLTQQLKRLSRQSEHISAIQKSIVSRENLPAVNVHRLSVYYDGRNSMRKGSVSSNYSVSSRKTRVAIRKVHERLQTKLINSPRRSVTP